MASMLAPVKKARSAMFLARRAELRPMSAFLEGFCADAGVAREQYLRLNVVLEELFVNTVNHGHRGDCDAPVWITVEARSEALQLVYEDTAPPFNPFAHVVQTRKLGGLGVLLTRELAASRDYTYLFGRNRLRLGLVR
jgi:serine/threonine-protein kinase RsbW